MEKAYHLEEWQNLYVMLGSSAAALAGLLFVAISLHAEAIASHPVLRARASLNTIMIVVLVIDAAIVLIPQELSAAGFEICGIALVIIGVIAFYIARVRSVRMAIPWRAYMAVVLQVINLIGGVSVIYKRGGGMYVLTVAFLAVLAWAMFNAWSILLAAHAENPSNRLS